MDPKKVRKTLDDLCSELDRRARSGPWPFLQRQGRQLGLGLVLGAGAVAGCSNSVPEARDAYGVGDIRINRDARDALPSIPDVYSVANPDSPIKPDARDALSAVPDASYDLPFAPDVYSVASVDTRDSASGRDAADAPVKLDASYDLPFAPDMYGLANVDTRDSVPSGRDASDAPAKLDVRDAASEDCNCAPPPDTRDLDGEGDG